MQPHPSKTGACNIMHSHTKQRTTQPNTSMKLLLIILVLLCSIPCFSQWRITGRIKDGAQGLAFATVVLLRDDSTFVSGVVTEISGAFLFDPVASGTYKISASMVGYSKYQSQIFTVGNEDVDVRDIILKESSTELNEIIVKENRQLLDQKMDRLVINLGGSITSSGNSILEVLQKSPGVVVNKQSNSISLNGRPGVRVMINDKPMQVPMEVVVQMLDGMNATNLERIELITSPPSQYDAEGSGGIIHLVTKKDDGLGTNGSFGLIAGARWAEAFGGTFNINHRNERFAFFVDYSISSSRNLHYYRAETSSSHNGIQQRISAYSHRENFTVQQNASVGFEWNLNQNSSLSILLTGYRRNWKLDADTDDIYQIGTDSTIQTSMLVQEKNLWQSVTASVAYQTKLNARSKIGIGLDYLYYENDNPSAYNNVATYLESSATEESKIHLSKSTPIRFLVAKMDYSYKISEALSFESGLKAVTSTLDNDVVALRQAEGDWILDPLFTSFSQLEENIYAGYLSAKWQPAEKWQVNGGLRYEYTHTNIGTPDQDNLVDRKYGYLFPSVSVKKGIASEKDLQFSYSKRITRPTYNDIEPYVFLWGPRTFSTGNTSLYPAIADAVSTTYHVRQWLMSVQFSHTQREIVIMQPELNSEANTITYRSENLKYMNTVALTLSYGATVMPWWDVQSTVTAQLQSARTAHMVDNISRDLYGVSVNITNHFRLPKRFSAEISGTYQSSTLLGFTQFLPAGSLNAGFQKDLGRNGIIRLSADDILNTNNWRLKTNSDTDLSTRWTYHWHNRFIRLTYTRTFGNNKLRSVRVKSASSEERNRVGN